MCLFSRKGGRHGICKKENVGVKAAGKGGTIFSSSADNIIQQGQSGSALSLQFKVKSSQSNLTPLRIKDSHVADTENIVIDFVSKKKEKEAEQKGRGDIKTVLDRKVKLNINISSMRQEANNSRENNKNTSALASTTPNSNTTTNNNTTTSFSKFSLMNQLSSLDAASKHNHQVAADRSVSTSINENSVTEHSGLENPLFLPGYRLLEEDVDFQVPDKTAAKTLKGGFGTVFIGNLVGKCLEENRNVTGPNGTIAAKYFRVMNTDHPSLEIDERTMISFLFEVAIMNDMLPENHPNIVKLVGYCERPLVIIMKFYSCSLRDLIRLPEKEIPSLPPVVRKIALDIASGLEFIHSKQILHLDLKPENVLLDITKNEEFSCVLCDFGFSNVVSTGKRVVAGMRPPIDRGFTLRYLAPEILIRNQTPEPETTKFDGEKIYYEVEDDNNNNVLAKKGTKKPAPRKRRKDITLRLNQEKDKKVDIYAFSISLYETIFRCRAWGDRVDSLMLHVQITKGVKPMLAPPDILQRYLEDTENGRPVLSVLENSWHFEAEERYDASQIVKLLQFTSPAVIPLPQAFIDFLCRGDRKK